MKKSISDILCSWSYDDNVWFPDQDYDEDVDYSYERADVLNTVPENIENDLPF